MKNKTYNSIWDINAPKKHWPSPSHGVPSRAPPQLPYGAALESPGAQSLDCFSFLFTLHLLVVSSSFITLHLDAGDSQIYISSLDLSPGSKLIIPYLSSLLGMIYKHLKLNTIKNEFLTSSQNMCQSQSPSFHLMDPSSFLLLRSNLEVILGCSLFLKLTSYPLVNPVA